MHLRKTHLAWLLALLCVLTASGYLYVRWYLTAVITGRAMIVEIAPGESLRMVADTLHAQGVLPHPLDLVMLARLHNDANAIRAGEYQVESGTSVAGLLQLLRSGKVVMHSLTLVDGWTFAQVLAAVEADPDLKHSLRGMDAAAIMTKLGYAGQNPEGMFYPDTYQFPRSTSDAAFLVRAYLAMQTHLQEAWRARAPGLPYRTPYEALIMASIIEKETAQPKERGEIAGVFVRRLQKGMKLQSDPTVIYGLGSRYHGKLTYKDLRTDTPYNSYTRYGLPPTPICMPGMPSIVAALHPTPGNALYFVARGDGTHQFSATLKEQTAAVEKYQIKHQPP
ncbi:MAG: endolytic transglycosylase MltG [Gammaproteobacteria bacterium]|nr:endolytic transglycosylase MltG [Gammaproteobacteria bacterium]MDE2346700.1 endolytic transglycosylase MltG [Gammaproteobacteria bacterium]